MVLLVLAVGGVVIYTQVLSIGPSCRYHDPSVTYINDTASRVGSLQEARARLNATFEAGALSTAPYTFKRDNFGPENASEYPPEMRAEVRESPNVTRSERLYYFNRWGSRGGPDGHTVVISETGDVLVLTFRPCI
ncbi:MAG: hypothetical protein ABEH77_02555 [Halobacteriaceae archaeon]